MPNFSHKDTTRNKLNKNDQMSGSTDTLIRKANIVLENEVDFADKS